MATEGEAAPSGSRPWTAVKVFLPPDPSKPSYIPPPPSTDDLKPTPSELKAAFSSHIAQRNGPDAPLMTKAMREREDARLGIKKKEYSEIRIRVRFSDRTMLEGLFPASTQIPALYAFVRAHLASKHAKSSFVLYQSPPRRDLPEKGDAKIQDATIKDLGMAPQAIINIRWTDSAMNSNTSPAPLDSSLLSEAKALPSPPSFDATGGSSSNTPGEGKKADAEGNGAKKAMPKWLKGLSSK